MKRIWFSPSTHWYNLIDGEKYYVRPLGYESNYLLMSFSASNMLFVFPALYLSYNVMQINRVSLYIP